MVIDASVVTIEEGVFEIAGTARSNKGGEAVTKIVTEHFAKMWEEELGIDVLNVNHSKPSGIERVFC